MDESKQRAMVTKSSSSSIKRKPLANLTNFLPSKKSVSSASSIGSTQNPTILIPPDQHAPSKSQKLTSDRLAGDENQTAQVQRHSTCNTRSTTKADVSFPQTSLQERINNVKQGYVSFGSSTLGKIKDQAKISQSSTEKINDKRKSTDVALSVTKNTNASTDKAKAKENAVQSNTGLTVAAVSFHQTSFHETRNNVKTGSVCFGSSTFDKLKDQGKKINQSSMEKISNKRKSVDVPLSSRIMNSINNNTDKDKGKENVVQSNTGLTMADDLMRRKDKGKAIAESPPSRKKLKNYMMDFDVPLKGVVIKERDGTDQHVPSKSQRLKPDCLAGEENPAVQGQKHRTQNTRSTTKVAFPVHQTSFQEKRNDVKQGSVSLCSSLFDKLKDQGTINQSSTEKINDKRKTADAPLSGMKNTNASTDRDKGKENAVQSNTGLTMADDLMKRKANGKAIAELPDYPSRKKLKNYMMDFNGPLKGVVIKERDGTVTGSNSISTPIKYLTLEKKDQQISCPPILRTLNNSRNDADVEVVLESKQQTEPPNKKKRRCSAKDVEVGYKLPKEFVEEQRAYFKEIDDFELQVEEV
ncbi:uncharacterized protein LOC143566087 [Bidens hawaiensis]|uniref:uncharacterized protein LOC143566087 n=1 Tax=Bidens hawaiensis TaxID=980011 RepID=UPI00404929A5